ncbi:MAG: anhydro-N-acetylmuramic acid kinase [Proteobacteria bacterium]|nr:anhydro-N-acetylmuramic acid kinase [Pseudomonadota bacterium]
MQVTDFAPLTALGLMSGTSMDGIDAAIVETDGERLIGFGPGASFPYDAEFRERLRGLIAHGGDEAEVARELTERHAGAVGRLLEGIGGVDVIGFHGHTVSHRPDRGLSRQIGDGAALARLTGIPVVDDFRSRDMMEGGEGAPLAPLFHAALARDMEKPVAVLNIGGVANLTWIGPEGELLAFDTGPGNALIDDWTLKTTGRPMDEDGRLARGGEADARALAALLEHPYFLKPPPKSLDRNAFGAGALGGASAADGAATLTRFTAAAVARARDFLPSPPRRWLVTGGGRLNGSLMAAIAQALEADVEPVEAVGWRGDVLEAQAFAFLAVRSLRGLPLSLPGTTGVSRPVSGGVLHRPPGDD